MRLNSLLTQRKKAILNRWFDLISHTYSDQMARFITSGTNQFANPVGHTFSDNIEQIFEHLIKGSNSDAFRPLCEKLMKIRAVQEFTASQAVGFIFLLKSAIRQELRNADNKKNQVDELKADPKLALELLDFESNIDGLALLGFEAYVQCREKVFEIKATELRNRAKTFMNRLQRMTDAEGNADPEDEQ